MSCGGQITGGKRRQQRQQGGAWEHASAPQEVGSNYMLLDGSARVAAGVSELDKFDSDAQAMAQAGGRRRRTRKQGGKKRRTQKKSRKQRRRKTRGGKQRRQ
jgi:hypothetical protein